MGINGLLPLLKSIEYEKRIDQYRGKRLAIDGYSWLHKAVYKSGSAIVKSHDYTDFMKSFLARVHVLTDLNIKVIMVFDGDRLPVKEGTEEKRELRREKKMKEAEDYYNAGDFHNADKKYAEAVDITPTIAYHTIEYVKKYYKDVECKKTHFLIF